MAEESAPTGWRRFIPFVKASKTTALAKPAGDGEWSVGPRMPIPLETYTSLAGNIEKTPVTEFSWKFLRDMTYTSDLLSLIVRTKTNETFRNGVSIIERFKSKCPECSREFEDEKVLCPFDGSEMKYPDYKQWIILNEFLKKMNRFDESVLTLMREVDTDVHIGDNGWLFLERNYGFGEDGKIVNDEVMDVLRMDPNMMRLIMSRYGMGTSETGSFTYFCPEHRQEVKEFAEQGEYECAACHRELIPAWYMSLTKAERIYYGPREIYHVKLYSNAQGVGVSPLLSCWMKINALLRMDKFMLEAYSLQRSPQELLILRGRKDSIHRAWEVLMQKARENPNMVWPLVLEGDDGSKSRVVEHETFSLKPIEWSWTEMRQEFRNVVGAVYGVQPIFSSGAQMQAGGLANEGLQLAVTTLAIKQEQHAWNMFLEFLSRQIGAQDYILKLNPNEQEDELRDLDVELKRLTLAQGVKEFGFKVELHRDAKGRLDFDYVEDPFAGQESEAMPEGFPTEDSAMPPEDEQKDMPPLTNAMTPEEQRQEQLQEQEQMNGTPPQIGDKATRWVARDTSKSNFTSKPKKIKRNPRGDEDADTTQVAPTTTFSLIEGHAGGM